jgi:PAS domain-containing protein
VTDAQNRVVARSDDPGRLAGDGSIVVPSSSGPEPNGLFQGSSADGMRVLYSFRRLRRAPGWNVVVGEPLVDYRTSWLRPLLVFLAGGSLALAFALALALALGRRIRSPVLALVQRAEVTATGPGAASPFALPPSPVAEFEELRLAMERSDAALRAGEAEFRAAFEQSAVPMQQTDCATGCFLRVNQAFCQLLGRPVEALIGLAFTEVTHPEDSRSSGWVTSPASGAWPAARCPSTKGRSASSGPMDLCAGSASPPPPCATPRASRSAQWRWCST